ncbi:unnamed protein product [Urochloa decumbens]|uniref:NAD-dependent epimerase/dehydratase domain-containing protein n=1 Tax=Urochloa decumbens TaxID=240449 RepID=A0ABC9D226_9POAL
MSARGEMKKTACVTGGNGYIASALIKMLLEKGYAVKTTVRNPDDRAKNSHLKDLQELGPLEVFRADLDDEGSFDDAIAGCDYAFLVAAPVNLASENPEKELIELGVQGTLNVMRSCVKAGTVKRIILTASSSGRICKATGTSWTRSPGPTFCSEIPNVPVLKQNADGSRASQAYPVSKVLLEEASRFAAEHGISLVTVLPVVTVGAAPARQIHTSVPGCLSLLSGDEAAFGALRAMDASGVVALVHVDDLCRAEVFVAEERRTRRQYTVNTSLLTGDLLEKLRVRLSSAMLVREGFEYKYKTLDGMYDDMIDYGKALGILPN